MTRTKPDTKEARFRRVVLENRARIYRICLAYLSEAAEADDLYQEILIRIWQNLDSFRGEANISTWVYRVAVNSALMYHRQQKRRLKLFVPSGMAGKGEGIAAPPPEAEPLDEQIAVLRQCIQSLPEQERVIASMLLDGLAYKEIAEVMGLTVNYIGVKINRIKKKLAQQMKLAPHGI